MLLSTWLATMMHWPMYYLTYTGWQHNDMSDLLELHAFLYSWWFTWLTIRMQVFLNNVLVADLLHFLWWVSSQLPLYWLSAQALQCLVFILHWPLQKHASAIRVNQYGMDVTKRIQKEIVIGVDDGSKSFSARQLYYKDKRLLQVWNRFLWACELASWNWWKSYL